MPVAEVRCVSLYYEVRGPTATAAAAGGPKVLFVAGSGGDLRVRGDDVEPLLPACTVLAYDHRGLGRSGRSPAAPTMADFAEDAIALLEAVGWDDAAVMGISFGGMVAQEIAIRAPGRVSRLVLVGTSSGGAGGASYPIERLGDLPRAERREARAALLDTRPERRAEAAAIAAARTAPPGDDAAREAERAQRAARAGHDTWSRLGAIACPTLVCVGRYDGLAPLANARALASAIPGAHLAVFDTGHYVLVQDPAAWDTVLGFLGATPTPRRP